MIKSRALEVNLAEYHVDVRIDPKYQHLQDVMSRYYGIMDGFNTFLKELSHPYKNWQFIVRETRNYSLNYFHLIHSHPEGAKAASLFIDVFADAIAETSHADVRIDAADNLLLFLQKIIKESGGQFEAFLPVLQATFDRIRDLRQSDFFLFVKSYYPLDRIAEAFLQNAPESLTGVEPLNRLLIRYFRQTYDYWLDEDDPWQWFCRETVEAGDPHACLGFFSDISHGAIKEHRARLEAIIKERSTGGIGLLKELLSLPGHNRIVENYRALPQKLLEAGETTSQGNQWKVFFLFHIMNISGLSLIHEEALRDINRTLKWLFSQEKDWNLRKLIQKTFIILKNRTRQFPTIALNCVLNMGKGVYSTDEIDLINFFIDSVIDLGFQYPNLSGVGDDWQVKVNNAHIQNIRTWLGLIEIHPKWSTRLLSSLIINLSLGGVFIKDTDLFPRDITRLLNSEIGPVFNLAKQLARLFPVYFNDIGAEGSLRDISTQIDEACHRKDVLIHFLRKQSHVEGSNQVLALMEKTLGFWESRKKVDLKPLVPPYIYNQIAEKGPYIDGVHRIVSKLADEGLRIPDDLLKMPEKELHRRLAEISNVSEVDRQRVRLAASFYRLLYQKYHVDYTELSQYINQLRTAAFPHLERLEAALAEPDLKKKLFMLLDYLRTLKELVLSETEYEAREDIYKKRHFTVDIPSMYGSYHELKFDALGLTFRIESVVNMLFEELVDSIDLSLITKATFYQIYARLRLFDKALKLDGLSSMEMELQLDMLAHSLEIKGFTITQYLDIFKGFARAVKNIINDYFNNVHQENLTRILKQISVDELNPKYLPRSGVGEDREKINHRVSEIFFRDQIAMSLGLQQLDLFLSRILNTLYNQAAKLPKDKLRNLLIYDPQNTIVPIEDAGSRVAGLIYLGNKGLNLMRLTNYGMRVPPGFIITTEVFRFRDIIESYGPAEENYKDQVGRHIRMLEQRTGKLFGNPKTPLLLSIRSGSSISQPGMMDTFLDVGMNEEIAEGIARETNNTWFAWDNYRRFLQCYGMSFDLERDEFDAIINDYKKQWEIPLKRNFTGEQMKSVAMAYKAMIRDAGIHIVEDPEEQLFLIIRKVFDSWDSKRARTYRKIMGISDDWGTAVTVQAMVYGNLSRQSGTGVVFTHNPRWSEDIIRLWGDFTLSNQGEDVVAGLVKTLPISISQQNIEMRDTDITLETHLPEIYLALKDWAHELIYKRGWSPQEIEFTFEGPSREDLYLLQTRDMAMRERKQVLTFYATGENKLLGHGIGVSGGAMSGRVVFSLDEIDRFRSIEPDQKLILARSDTVPDDIREIFAADGLLTARGGLTSHAAVVAHRLGKTCVVSCANMVCNEKNKQLQFHQEILTTGDMISIDGQEGAVYKGKVKIRET